MGKFIISGGKKLDGEIIVEGAKNAVLPILAATILNQGISFIKNCPKLRDVEGTIQILKSIGCSVKEEDNILIIDSSTLNSTNIPENLAVQMRSSIVFMGAMLSKYHKVSIYKPGGCEIGPRPIDLHIKALKKMGVSFVEPSNRSILCECDKIKGEDIYLEYPSVGATQNIMLAAVMAEGTTHIKNAAKEPEVVDLQDFLNKMGANVSGAGTNTIEIIGVDRLKDVEYTVIPDRIVAGTYLIAAGITSGNICLKNMIPEHIMSLISVLRDLGCKINIKHSELHIKGPVKTKSLDILRTLPYPGFPTDMQAQLMALLSISTGTSVLVETVFENRYKHVEDLIKMGAKIRLEGRTAIIKGVEKLMGASVEAKDLRGGAALLLAGLAADGETIIHSIDHIDRGYQQIEEKLNKVGASIIRG